MKKEEFSTSFHVFIVCLILFAGIGIGRSIISTYSYLQSPNRHWNRVEALERRIPQTIYTEDILRYQDCIFDGDVCIRFTETLEDRLQAIEAKQK